MASTMPLRIGDDVVASAQLAAGPMGRSVAQQVGYWAKLGRELERSGEVSAREISEVLAGARSYDDLGPKAQAVVRAEWADRTEARRRALDLAEEFAAEGRSWVEQGPDGRVVRHPSGVEAAAARPAARPRGGKTATTKAGTREPGAQEAAGSIPRGKQKAGTKTPTKKAAVAKAAPKGATARPR